MQQIPLANSLKVWLNCALHLLSNSFGHAHTQYICKVTWSEFAVQQNPISYDIPYIYTGPTPCGIPPKVVPHSFPHEADESSLQSMNEIHRTFHCNPILNVKIELYFIIVFIYQHVQRRLVCLLTKKEQNRIPQGALIRPTEFLECPAKTRTPTVGLLM